MAPSPIKGRLGVRISYPFQHWKENVEQVEKDIGNRNFKGANIRKVVQLHEEYSEMRFKLDLLRKEKNKLVKSYSKSLKSPAVDAQDMLKPSGNLNSSLTESLSLKDQVKQVEEQFGKLEAELYKEASLIPNCSSTDSPVGNESNNVVIASWTPASLRDTHMDPTYMEASKAPENGHLLTHMELGEALDICDCKTAAKTIGSGFFYWKNQAVLLELGLINYVLSIAMKEEHGFVPMMTPDLAKVDWIHRCGFMPRSEDEELRDPPIFKLAKEGCSETVERYNQLGLIGTSEIPLALYHADSKLREEDLPKRYIGVSHCFRPELGQSFVANTASSGASTASSVYRVHQFTKVELFVFCSPESSSKEFDKLVALQQQIYAGLNIPYRVLNMSTEELGAAASKKFDIEAWMPGLKKWGEISSASNCTDFQARRLDIRYQPSSSSTASPDANDTELYPAGKSRFVHTLNATALAVPRIIIALLENGQLPDGSVKLPDSLAPFLPNLHLKRPCKQTNKGF